MLREREGEEAERRGEEEESFFLCLVQHGAKGSLRISVGEPDRWDDLYPLETLLWGLSPPSFHSQT